MNSFRVIALSYRHYRQINKETPSGESLHLTNPVNKFMADRGNVVKSIADILNL